MRVSAGVAALLSNSAAWAQQLPTGGAVAGGSATIVQPNANTLNINQSTNQAIINWNSFSVGRGGTVNFNQPNSSSATLNRVLGTTASTIAGSINAPGTVLLVNPNGIAITKSGVVNTGSFAASTLDISNNDFMAGNYRFTGNGGSAAVRNSGRINVSDGGFAALLGGQVANNGIISARLGRVGLGAGELITLDLAGDGFLSVAVPSSQLGKLVDASGALVSNRGKIRADGGSVYLTAATASNILRDAVNVPGSIRANTVGTRNGKIVIGGGTGGKVTVTGKLVANGNSKRNGGKIEVTGTKVDLSGKLTADGKSGGAISATATDELLVRGTVSAKGKDGTGGRIDLTGANVGVIGALIDASGAAGGLVRIGGTFQGGNGDSNDPFFNSYIGRFGALPDIASAQAVIIDENTKINISATSAAGNAGSAIIWSEQFTNYAGTILGTGGQGGKGGYAEISSHGVLGIYGGADLTAIDGEGGRLLLDPFNVTINAGTNNVTPTGSPLTYTPTATATINVTALAGLLNAGNNVVVTTGTGGTAGVGSITVSAALSWTSANSLTLSATTTTTVSSAITATNGALILNGGSSGTPTISVTAAINVANLTINANAAVTATSAGAVITTPNLRLLGAGATFSLTNASNNIGTVAAAITGTSTVSLTDSQNLSIGSVGGTNGITATTVNLVLGSGKTASQSQSITATSLSLAGSNATYNLANTSNSITTLAAGTNGARLAGITFVNSKAVTINTVGSSNVIAATGAINVTALGATADITISRAISTTYAGTGNGITLTAGRDVKIGATLIADNATGTAINLIAARNIQINNYISAATGILTLQAGSDAFQHAFIKENITGNAGSIYVDRLLLKTAATLQANGPDVTLGYDAGGNDYLSTVAGSVASLDLYIGSGLQSGPSGGLTVGTIGGVSGLTASGDISLKTANDGLKIAAPISTPGTLTLGILDISATAAVNVGSFMLISGSNWAQVAANLPTFSAGNFYVDSGATFLRAAGGDGGANPYVITDIYGLQGINSVDFNSASPAHTLLAKNFILGGNIDGSGTANWNGFFGNGFIPIGADYWTGITTAYSGTFNGNGFTVSGLKINQPAKDNLGLFAQLTGAVKDLSLTGINVLGSSNVGGIAGYNAGTITNSSVSGTISGVSQAIGGLAGSNQSSGLITNSSSTAGVSGTSKVGGLAGENHGSIVSSSAGGSASGVNSIGGLVGYNYADGAVAASFATGTVDAPYGSGSGGYAGGLVGTNEGSISSSYATGNVTGSIPVVAGYMYFGGLAGVNGGTITNSYATGNVMGSSSVGGLVGSNGASGFAAGSISNSYAAGTATGSDQVGGLAGANAANSTITLSYATGAVSGVSNVGGLIGSAAGSVHEVYATGNVIASGSVAGGLIGLNNATVTNAYATGSVSGDQQVGGLVGQNNGTLASVYSIGVASGNAKVGALIGSYVAGSLTSAYWDTTTAGATGIGDNPNNLNVSGAQGLATLVLQGALPSGFSSTYWGIVANTTYPFLMFQPGVVSGTVYSTYGGSSVAGVSVSELVNGAGSTTVITDANGRYFFFLPGLATAGGILIYTANGATYKQGVTAAVVADVYGSYLTQATAGSTANSLATGLSATLGGNSAVVSGLTNKILNLTGGSFTIDQSIAAGTLIINTSGTVGQSAAIIATSLILAGTGATYNLTNTGNQILTLAANTGSLTVNDSASLTVNTVAGINGITATGAVTLNADSIALTAVTGRINAAGQTVTLAPNTVGKAVIVGTGTNALVIDPSMLALISSDTLVIGNATAGALTVNQSIAPNAVNLALVSGSTVTQTGGVITVSGLGVQGTTISLLGTTTATTFASSSVSGPTINVSGDITIAAIGPISGISWTDSTTASIKATGNITIAGLISNNGGGSLVVYADSAATGTGTISFTGNGAINFGGNAGNVSLYERPGSSPTFTNFAAKVTMGSGVYSQYNLIDSVTDLQNINANLAPSIGFGYAGYALNRDLDLASVANFTPLGADLFTPFTAIFDGQFHTISNLTVSIATGGDAGLFGGLYGTVRNLALVNVNISGPFGASAGGVAGESSGGAVIDQVYVTGVVSGTHTGGVVGVMSGSASISNTFANVRVVGDNNDAGGLVGEMQQTSSIRQSLAIGYVTGTGQIGGLVGSTFNGNPTITSSYWDNSTAGVTIDGLASSANGQTTSALQGTLPGGLGTSIWATGAGLYPYLKSFFPTAPQAVSGTAYSDRGVTALQGGTVNGLANGVALGSVTTGANGYYYFLTPGGTFAAGAEVVAYTTGANAGVTYQPGAAAMVSNLNVYGGYLTTITGASTLSAAPALVGTSAVRTIANGLSFREYDLTSANFDIDQAISLTSKVLAFNTTGTVTQSAGISVTGSGSGLLLLGTGATYNLTSPANNVTTLAANTGTVNFNNGANVLTVGTVAGTAGITATNLFLTDTNAVNASGAKIAATNLLLSGGGAYTLTNASNVIGNLAGNTGAVSVLNSSGTLTVATVNGVTGLSASGAVALTTNAISIAAALNASAQTVTIRGTANGTAIGLGSGGTLTLSQTSLNNITASSLVMGGTSMTAGITVTGAVTTPAGVTNLSLITTGTISIATGNSLTNSNSNGSITLQTNVSPTLTGTLVANSTSGTVNITTISAASTIGLGTGAQSVALTQARLNQITAANLVIGSPSMTAGITITSGAGAPLTLGNVTNLTMQTAGVISFSSTSTQLNLSTNNGSITLLTNTSPSFTGSATLRATGTNSVVTIAGLSAGTTLRLGSGTGGNIALTQAIINAITASTLVLGRSDSFGSITVNGTGISLGAGITNLTLATGSTINVSSGAPLSDLNANGVLTLQGAGGLSLTEAVSVAAATGTIILNTAGTATQAGALTAAKLLLTGVGNYTLTTMANSVGTLAASVGALSYAQNASLSIGTIGAASGVAALGAVTIMTGGASLTIASGSRVSGANVVLAVTSANGAFINNQGSDAVTASTRWLVYSTAPANDNFNALDSANTAIWNSTYASLPPASISVASGNRYIFAYQPTLTFTSTDVAKTYGDTASVAAAYSVSGLQAGVANAFLGDTASAVYSGGPALSSLGTAGTADVAGSPYGITITANNLTSLAGYAFAFSSTGNLAVNQRAVTVTADALSRDYGDANPALTYTTSSLGQGTAIVGSLTTSATATSNVGSYSIDQGGVTNAANSNYLITYQSNNLTVGQRAVTVTADAKNRDYGDATPALTFTTTSLGAGTSIVGSLTTSATASSNVGAYSIDQGGVTNAANSNYLITYQAANLAVGQRAVTVTADAKSRDYGDSNPTLTYTTSSLGAGTAIVGSLTTSATATSNVGSYSIDRGGVTNAANSNYLITYQSNNLTVGQRGVTVTADAKSRDYGDANPALTFTTTSLGAGAAVVGSLTTSATATSNVGTYSIDQGGVTNAANSNYLITYQAANLTVGQRAVIVTADAKSRDYGDSNPALTYTTSSLGAGTAIVGSLTTSATASSNVGSYSIDRGGVTNAANSNYLITYQSNNLTVGQRGVTVTADAKSRDYGDANPALTFTTTSLGAGAAVVGSLTTSATATSNVGTYSIDQGGVTNAANSNYVITYQSNNLTVGQRAVTVTADAKSRDYGDATPALTFTTTSLGAGTSIVGSLTTSATASSNVGAYSIDQGGVTNAANSNYLITYQSNNLTVGQRAVTVTADAQTKTYGDSNPALTYTTSSLGAGAAIVGSLTTSATASNNVGTYSIDQGGVTNAANSNYLLTYQSANLTVGQRAVTVTADAQTKTYGDANPTLTFTTTGLGAGTAIAGSLATAAASSDVGIYGITQGNVVNANNPNYVLTYVGANLTINRALLTIIADDKTRVVNAPNPVLTATYSGLVNGDNSNVVSGLGLTTLANVNTPVGQYAIDAAGAAASNYTIAYVSGRLSVTSTGTTTTPNSPTNPAPPSLPVAGVTIPSPPTPSGITQISFTPPPTRVTNTRATDAAPASLTQGRDLAANNGLTYSPISQFDPNQYEQFKLPDYSAQAGEAAIFAMIARAADAEHAADDLIDAFWNGTSGAWTPPKTAQVEKVTFSDGAGNKVDPTGHAGFPIVAGSTDFAQLLKTGPVMISDGGQPAHWLLATQMTADGKGIVANDPASGKQVVLNYDASTKTVGGVTGVFDANSNKFVSFAEASVSTPGLAGLQGFVPSTFLAVTAK